MRITELKLKHVGPFEEQVFEFQKKKEDVEGAEIHIFTGANGSGKSTVLFNLSSNFFELHQSSIFQIKKRFWNNSSNAEIEIKSDKNENFKIWQTNENPFQFKYSGLTKNIREYFLYKFKRQQSNVQSQPLNFACFAYSGYRDFSSQNIETIKELKINPLQNALKFNKPIKNQVNQWIANMIAKQAISSQKKQTKRAKNYRSNIAKLEEVLTELFGEPISFDLETDPTNLVLNKNGIALDFDVIPDGLKSIISWIGDLLMRLDKIKWETESSIFEKNIILFLDEIEVHLHPKWQMKVLPIVQKLFPNAQIFLSTHSPFVVNSVDNAWVYKLKMENGLSKCAEVTLSDTSKSYAYVLEEVFDVQEKFGLETEEKLNQFYEIRNKVMHGQPIDETVFKELIKELLNEGIEVQQMIGSELRQLERVMQKAFSYDEN